MATKISNYVTARVIDNKAISLAALYPHYTIKLWGSTVPTSSSRTGDYGEGLNQLTLYPEHGKSGIVAVVITIKSIGHKGRVDWTYIPAFLEVSWKEKEGQKYPFIDLEEPWIPADRIGQITERYVEVVVGSKRFCTYDHFLWSHNKGKDLPGYVPDGNLLCRYLWGSAHSSEVLHAAVQQKLEPTTVKRVELMTREIRILEGNKRVLENQIDLRDVLIADLETRVETMQKDFATKTKGAVALYNALRSRPSWMRSKASDDFVVAMDGIMNWLQPKTA